MGGCEGECIVGGCEGVCRMGWCEGVCRVSGCEGMYSGGGTGGVGGVFTPQLYRVGLLLAVTNCVVHYNQRELESDDIKV